MITKLLFTFVQLTFLIPFKLLIDSISTAIDFGNPCLSYSPNAYAVWSNDATPILLRLNTESVFAEMSWLFHIIELRVETFLRLLL